MKRYAGSGPATSADDQSGNNPEIEQADKLKIDSIDSARTSIHPLVHMDACNLQ